MSVEMMRLNKYKRVTLLSVAASFLVLFPLEVNAMPLPALLAGIGARQILMWFGLSALVPLGLGAIKWTASIAAFIITVGFISSTAGKLLDWGIQYQNVFFNLPVIQTIWTVLRDFINIFFILVLLVIAFATIFNIKEYKASDLLPKLIIAALLINFSLVIASSIIDILWYPAKVFLDGLNVSGQASVSGQIVNALSIQSFFDPNFIAALSGGQESLLGSGTAQIIARGTFLVVNTFILTLVTLIIWARIPILIGLMMVSPIVWLGFTVPAIRKNTWDAWWDKLLHWGVIPIPLFAIIYFIALFKSRLTEQIGQGIPFQVLNEPLSFIGFPAQLVFVWLIVIGLFVAGIMYMKSLTGNFYSWTKLGFKRTWGGIRGGVGRGVDYGYETLGYKGAVERTRERFAEEGPLLGRIARERRAAKWEDRLAGRAGLGPTYAAQRNLLDQSEKATRDIDSRFKQARSLNEQKEIINELKAKIDKGAKDPVTLAVINTLAKKGELDTALFNKAVENFKDTPLALNKIFSEWKEGKFGGIAAPDLLKILRDERIPLEAKRTGYNFVASDDGKKVAEKMEYEDFKIMYETLGGRMTKSGREAKKFIGEIKPTIVAEYNLRFPSREFDDPKKYPKDIEDAVLKQIEKTDSKNFTKYHEDEWKVPEFVAAIEDMLDKKQKMDSRAAAKYVEETRKWLIRESKDAELKIFNAAADTVGIS